VRVKVCGVTRCEDALFAASRGADFIGLVRAASPRQVAIDTARAIATALPPATLPVLVFHDAPLDEVCATLDTTGIRWVQLHGGETVAYAHDLVLRLPNVPLIRAWEVAGPQAATHLLEHLRAAADTGVRFQVLLLDAPKGRQHPGYGVLGDVSRRCRGQADEIWCAGGLTPENVAAAVRAGDYDGVDVSRGVELRPGVKDQAALARFIAAARAR